MLEKKKAVSNDGFSDIRLWAFPGRATDGRESRFFR